MVNWNEEDYQKHLQRVDRDHRRLMLIVLIIVGLAIIGVLALGLFAYIGFIN